MPREPSLPRSPVQRRAGRARARLRFGQKCAKNAMSFTAIRLSDVRQRLSSCRPTSTSGSLDLSLSTAVASSLLPFASAALEGGERERRAQRKGSNERVEHSSLAEVGRVGREEKDMVLLL